MSASTHSAYNVFFAFVGWNDASYIERAVGVSTAVIVILHIFLTGNHLCKRCITPLNYGQDLEQYKKPPYPPQVAFLGTLLLLLSLLFPIDDEEGNTSPPDAMECTACSFLIPPPQSPLHRILIHHHDHGSPSSHLPHFTPRKHLVWDWFMTRDPVRTQPCLHSQEPMASFQFN